MLYLQDCAQQAGQESRFIYIEDLGLGVGGVLTDLDDNVIQRAFKLYPLEWMMRDDNGPLLRKRREQWVEPLWKSILSNKGLMPLLWRFFPGHPNLLASWFEGEKSQIAAGESYVRKPIYSREGGNVTIFDGQNNVVDHTTRRFNLCRGLAIATHSSVAGLSMMKRAEWGSVKITH